MEKTTSNLDDVTTRLTEQHRWIRAEFDFLINGSQTDRADRLATLLAYLALHEAVEQRFLHRHLPGGTQRGDEEDALAVAASSLQLLPVDSPEFAQLAGSLGAAVAEHQGREEHELAAGALTAEQLGEAHRALDIVAQMTQQSGGPFPGNSSFAQLRHTARAEINALDSQLR